MQQKKNDKIRNEIFINPEKLAEQIGISPFTLRKHIHTIEKAMGFEEGDLQKLVEMTVNEGRYLRVKCKHCGEMTTRTKQKCCKMCEEAYGL